jgi:hypothetical protein
MSMTEPVKFGDGLTNGFQIAHAAPHHHQCGWPLALRSLRRMKPHRAPRLRSSFAETAGEVGNGVAALEKRTGRLQERGSQALDKLSAAVDAEVGAAAPFLDNVSIFLVAISPR